MITVRRETRSVSDAVVREIANRDAALWIGEGLGATPAQAEQLKELIQLPWQLVLCEPKSRALTDALEAETGTTETLRRRRGFLHLIASDPEALQLPQRSLPVFLLNGREHTSDPSESPTIGRNASLRRRLNMIQRLEAAMPRMLVVLSHGGSPLEDVIDLWASGFRAQLTVVSDDDNDAKRLDQWLAERGGFVEHCRMSVSDLVTEVASRVSGQLTADRYVLRMQIDADRLIDLDVTDCELVQQPLLDKYELIQSQDLRALLPEDLPQDEFQAFFDKSKQTWMPYAAGLPWRRFEVASRRVLGALGTLFGAEDDSNSLLIIASEAGAGGTTLARMIAFDAASQGFPTLVARDIGFRPDFTTVETFLYRIRQEVLRKFWRPKAGTDDARDEDGAEPYEVPWLIVFDVEHWRGRESDLRRFARDLGRRGRPAVVLAVSPPRVHDELRAGGQPPIAVLTHEISMEDAQDLGKHINRFLTPYGKAKSAGEWQSFWETHRPYIGTDIAAFWIALEFWLKRHLDLSESIQGWLYRQFKQDPAQADAIATDGGQALSDDMRKLILEIAALSIERMPFPEGLMPSPPADQLPYSVQLENARTNLPGLALVREGTSTTRQWALAHDILGRYLLTSVFQDREMLDRLGYKEAKNATDLRLKVLRLVATKPEIARKRFLFLALEFATNIFKIDDSGNLDFMPYWREVLTILEEMPALIWDTSRTFNHHVAVSRRRVVALDKFFHLSPDEKVQELELAIEHLNYALEKIKPGPEDESDLVLLNSLSLAYQNLADIERERGCSPDRLRELRVRAADAARRAQQKGSSSNSFVLETLARNLLQDGALDPDRTVESAAEALSYINQALSLDTSEMRYNSLMRLASGAVQLLQTPRAIGQIDRLCRTENPMGFMAKAFLLLALDAPEGWERSFERLPRAKVEAALQVLDEAKDEANSLILKLRYDLVCVCRAHSFSEQLDLLDQLEGAIRQLPPQLVLERAILLHQRNRHAHAKKEFKTLRELLYSNDVYVSVPDRLRWLLTLDGKAQRIVEARVADQVGYHSKAKARVKELENALIPYVPQDFGRKTMSVGELFKCAISFGAMGPFIRPPKNGAGRE
jgi:hypothetical protein